MPMTARRRRPRPRRRATGGDPDPRRPNPAHGGPDPDGRGPHPGGPPAGTGARAASGRSHRPAADAARAVRTARRDPRLRPPRPRARPPASHGRGGEPPHRGLRHRHQPRGIRHRPRLRPPDPDVTPGRPASSPIALPARLNLTIPATALPGLAGLSGNTGPWSLTPRGRPGTQDDISTWTLALPGGRELTVRIDPVPVFECDHRYETHGYQPSDRLRHLVQIRDGTCTFPTCNRHARDVRLRARPAL